MMYGSAQCRSIARNMFKLEMIKGKIASFFETIIHDENANVHIVSSSFGGFGSGIVHELVTYLMGLYHLKHRRRLPITVICFNEHSYLNLMQQTHYQHHKQFHQNTTELVHEYYQNNNEHESHLRMIYGPDYFHISYTFLVIDCMNSNVFFSSTYELRNHDVTKQYLKKEA